jgi:hypothetical protein
MTSFGSVPAACRRVTIAESSERFLSFSVPEESWEMPERYRAMVLLVSWCALRFGELTELRRGDITIFEPEDNDGGDAYGLCTLTEPSSVSRKASNSPHPRVMPAVATLKSHPTYCPRSGIT